jgi:hypothetical protein
MAFSNHLSMCSDATPLAKVAPKSASVFPIRHKPFVFLSLLAVLLLWTVGTPGVGTASTCTAGNPNPNVIETTPTADFADHGDGTVTHTKTGLMWKQCVEGLSGASCATGEATNVITWANALNAANTANASNGGSGFANHTGWRLPNQKELQSIVESCGNGPSINQTVFPATPPSGQYFWSATTYVSLPAYAWSVTFSTGDSNVLLKGNNGWVRLVRGGPPIDSFDELNPTTTLPVLQGAASRKVHGAAGTFDLALSAVATNPTTEPRQGPAQTIVFTFDRSINAATATITEGTATAGAPTFSGNDVIVGLTGVTNQQYVTVSLTGVASSDGSSGGTGSVRVGFLLGDVSQNRVISIADLAQVNAQLAQPVTAANFLKDVNASGTLSLADKAIANANLTRALPAP